MLIHCGPRECLIANTNKEGYSKIIKVLEKHNILITEKKKSNLELLVFCVKKQLNHSSNSLFLVDFATDNECVELNRLVKLKGDQSVINLVELKNPLIIGCLNALIKYLDVRQL